MFLPASLAMLAVAFLFRFGNVFWTTLAPVVVVQELGYSSTDYSSWTATANFIAAVAGLLVGFYIDRKGVKLLYGLALLSYGLLAVAVGLLEVAWSSPRFLLSILFLQSFIYQAVFISFIATSMSLCWVKISVTQFAIYMAWANLGLTFGGMVRRLRPDTARLPTKCFSSSGSCSSWRLRSFGRRTCRRTGSESKH